MKKRIITLLLILFVISMFYSSYKIIRWKLNVKENNEIKLEVNKYIKTIDNNANTQYNIDFDNLKNINKDVVGYLKLNNTNIDYVVVKSNDNSYYLNHNLNNKNNSAGWIFADYHNKFDSTDKNIVIYGHNMKDGSMFGTLRKVLNRDWQNDANNLKILLITPSQKYEYEVFSTYSIDVEDYYINTEFKTEEKYSEFLLKIRSRSNKDYNIEVSTEDRILTLSTCTGNGKKRVVVHAKLIKE